MSTVIDGRVQPSGRRAWSGGAVSRRGNTRAPWQLGLILVAVVMIAFRVHEHFWLVQLLGGYVITAFAPILVLVAALIIQKGSHPAVRSLRVVWVPLLLYLGTASLSLLLNEPDVDGLITWLAYVWAPALVFASLLCVPAFNTDDILHKCVTVLVAVGLVLSLYAVYSFGGVDAGPTSNVTLETNVGDVSYRTTYAAGLRGQSSLRWTVPGLNTTHFAPMLLPLVFIGLFMARQRSGVRRLVCFAATAVLATAIVGSLTRAAMIPVIIGLAYLRYVNWYGRLGTVMAAGGLALLFSFQPLMLARILLTFSALVPMQGILGNEVGEEGTILAALRDGRFEDEDHLETVPFTVEMILERPMLGRGWTSLIDDQGWLLEDLGGKDHNNYLSIGAAFGVPALTFYVSFIVGLGLAIRKALKRTVKDSPEWQMGHAWAAILIAYAFYLIGAPAEFHFVWLWFGLMTIWARNRLAGPSVLAKQAPAWRASCNQQRMRA